MKRGAYQTWALFRGIRQFGMATSGAAKTPLGAVRDKFHEAVRLHAPWDRFSRLKSLLHIQSTPVEKLVSFFYIGPGSRGDPFAPHSHRIETANHIDDDTHGEGWDVLTPSSASPDHAHLSDPQKLVKDRPAAEDHIVTHLHITRKKAVIGHDRPVANGDIVP